jgi:hypothetical protein
MMRIFSNLVKATLHLAFMAALGWVSYTHNFEGNHTKEIALAINIIFAALGASLVLTWVKNKTSDPPSARTSSQETITSAVSAESSEKTDKSNWPLAEIS